MEVLAENNDNDISSLEKQKLLAVAHRFVNRYQQTRDLAPLLPEFSVHNLGECLMEMRKSEEGTKNELTKQDIVRGYVAELNLLYIGSVAYNYVGGGSDDDVITKLFPPQIAKRFNSVAKAHDLLVDSDFSDRKRFLVKLRNIEATISEAQSYLYRKRIERSAKYQKEFRKNEKGLLNYSIKTVSLPEEFLCKAIFGTGTKEYIVFTPLGLQLIFVKIHHRFKLVLASPITD